MYKDHGACVFHSERTEDKLDDFSRAFRTWIAVSEERLELIDLSGFVFPSIQLESQRFSKPILLSGARIQGESSIIDCIFDHPADISNATFEGSLRIQNSNFKADLDISNSEFKAAVFFLKNTFVGDFLAREVKFHEHVAFNHNECIECADLTASVFEAIASFDRSTYHGNAEFCDCRFGDSTEFGECAFDGSADFQGAQFEEEVKFANSVFGNLASFWMTEFGSNASFFEARFEGNAIFWMSTFNGIADFRRAVFLRRTEFKGGTFTNEILLSESQVEFLKELDAAGVCLEGTVLYSAHLWGMKKLEGYSFKDSFLISLSLANKEIVDCDFTGAVFDSVITKGWMIDDATVANTKYIYTSFAVVEATDEQGIEQQTLKPLPESRIPATGEFGSEENSGFTLREYFKDSTNIQYSLEMPEPLRAAVSAYLGYFPMYATEVYASEVRVSLNNEGHRARLILHIGTEDDALYLRNGLAEFIGFMFLDQREGQVKDRCGTELLAARLLAACTAFDSDLTLLMEHADDETKAAYGTALEALKLVFAEPLESTPAEAEESHEVDSPGIGDELIAEGVEDASGTSAFNGTGKRRTIEIDQMLEIKFSLDDLEGELETVRQENSHLEVKVFGIKKEIAHVRDTTDDMSRLDENIIRMEKIIERVRSLSTARNGNAPSASNAKAVESLCARLERLLPA
ncbi:MAG: hypothetical protein CL946_02520 [Ectothiorhodospiraceae bacterium]|nr:hypothetical protein [Ectothiorhodospiraceae bacterium]